MRPVLGPGAKSPALCRYFANPEVHAFSGIRRCARGSLSALMITVVGRASTDKRGRVRYGKRAYRGTKAELRDVLLSPEYAVCSLGHRALPHLPPGPSRRAPAPKPAPLRVSPGAPAPGGVGVSDGQRAGGASRIARPDAGHEPEAITAGLVYVSPHVLATDRRIHRVRAPGDHPRPDHGHLAPGRRRARRALSSRTV